MKPVPNRLQCAYCIRNYTHGGECHSNMSPIDEKGCLAFSPDERGCIRNRDWEVPFRLYSDIPMLNEWLPNWQINKVDTEIKINRIYGLSWDIKKGLLIVHCNCDYFVNEYHEDFFEVNKKPKLTVINCQD